jgi:hypothetical protein
VRPDDQQCDELVVPFNFDSQDAKAAIRIVKSHALNQTRQWLPFTRVVALPRLCRSNGR